MAQQVGALQDGWADSPGVPRPARHHRGDGQAVRSPTWAGSRRWTSWPAPFWPQCPRLTRADAAPPARIGAGLLRLALDRAQALSRADAGRRADQHAPPGRQDRPARRRSRAARPGGGARPDRRRARRAGPAGRRAAGARRARRAAAAGRLGPRHGGRAGTGRARRRAAAAAGGGAGQGRGPVRVERAVPPRPCRSPTRSRSRSRGRAGRQAVTAHEIRDRVRARFPALPPLPDRPRLDQLIATPGSAWSTTTPSTATAGRPAPPTPRAWPHGRPPSPRPRARSWSPAAGPGTGWPKARATRSFLALGVDADRADRAVEALTGRFGAAVVDVTQVLIDAMRAQAAEVGLPWDLVQAADAAPRGQPGRGRARRAGPAQPARRRGRDRRGGFRRARREPARSCSPRSRRSPGTATWPC